MIYGSQRAQTLALAASRLLACGLRPVPMVTHAKCPSLKGWREAATLDPVGTAEQFSSAPNADGIGIATGTNVFVIDLDRAHSNGADGIACFAALVRERGSLPAGPRVHTPSGGLHLYFGSLAERVVRTRTAILPGVDVRGEGGLAMCPPSARDGKPYRWSPAPWECSPPQAPTWILDLVAPIEVLRHRSNVSLRPFSGELHPYARAAFERERAVVAECAKGARNATLFKAAAALGSLAAGGALSAQSVVDALMDAAHACGLVADDGRGSVEATIASGLKHGLDSPRTAPRRTR